MQCYRNISKISFPWHIISVESVYMKQLIISVTWLIICTIWGVFYIIVAHSNLGDREDTFITLRFTVMQSEVSTFPIVVIFSVVVSVKWLYHHMLAVSYLSRESWGFFLVLLCSLMMWATKWIHDLMAVLHYLIMTYLKILNSKNACHVHILSSVC